MATDGVGAEYATDRLESTICESSLLDYLARRTVYVLPIFAANPDNDLATVSAESIGQIIGNTARPRIDKTSSFDKVFDLLLHTQYDHF
jgi:hypothetical protein